MNDFRKYATKHLGINSMTLNDYGKHLDKLIIPTNMTPYIMEERQFNVAQVDVFSRLMIDRIIWIIGEIDDVNAAVVQAQLMYLDNSGERDITIHVDSPGGSVYAGKKIISVIDYVECNVSTINTGLCASMGAVILAAGKKGKRFSLKYSRTMIHSTSGGAVGNIHDARISMKEWEKENEELFRMLGDYCGKESSEVQRDSERDRWMDPIEAKEYGLIDSIVKPRRK